MGQGQTFAEKFEEALEERRAADSNFGVKTVARKLADGDPKQTELIRRRLNKYRPRPGRGGAAESIPTEPTRREIEKALGLPVEALEPEPDLIDALTARARDARQAANWRQLIADLRDEIEAVPLTNNAPTAHQARSAAGAST